MVDERFYKRLGPLPLVELVDGLDIDIPEGRFCDLLIEDAAPADQAGVRQITYLEGKTAKKKIPDCQAEVCLVTPSLAEPVGAQNVLALKSENPRADFARILTRLYRKRPFQSDRSGHFDHVDIGPGAVIDKTATIGPGSSIGPNAVIGPGVVIGKNCQIGAGAVIEFTVMGDACHILSGAVLGGDGFGVVRTASGTIEVPHVGIVKLEDNVTIGSLSAIDRAMFGETFIGTGTKLDNLIQIAHNVRIGRNVVIAAQTGISGSCTIGDNVLMGGNVGLADHLDIGEGAVLAANAQLMHNVPAGEVWSGVPAQPIRQHMREIAMIRKMLKTNRKKTS